VLRAADLAVDLTIILVADVQIKQALGFG